jgi:murein DD-endopeptidase MepM/ murein hydrolase activator NlpD
MMAVASSKQSKALAADASFGFRGIVSAVVFFLVFPAQSIAQTQASSPSASPAPLAELSNDSSADGSIVVLTVHLPHKTDPNLLSAALEGTKNIPFFEDAPTAEGSFVYRAILAVPFNHAPGKVDVQVALPPSVGQTLTLPLTIVDGHYRSEVLKVDERKVSPPAKDMKRITAEQQEIKQIYDQITREKFWRGPFSMPVKSTVTSPFGSKRVYNGEMKSFHQGLDLRARMGTPIHAPAAGRVVLAKNLFFTGNTVLLDHGYGVFTLYGHMSKLKVKKGDLVRTGTVLGLAGMTGRANGPHLHWGAIVHHLKVNPLDLTKVMP